MAPTIPEILKRVNKFFFLESSEGICHPIDCFMISDLYLFIIFFTPYRDYDS